MRRLVAEDKEGIKGEQWRGDMGRRIGKERRNKT